MWRKTVCSTGVSTPSNSLLHLFVISGNPSLSNDRPSIPYDHTMFCVGVRERAGSGLQETRSKAEPNERRERERAVSLVTRCVFSLVILTSFSTSGFVCRRLLSSTRRKAL